jgi:hypothetical protein
MGLPWFAICPTKESTFSSESTQNQFRVEPQGKSFRVWEMGASKVPDAKLQDSVLKAPKMC